jgi:hypothetical protein
MIEENSRFKDTHPSQVKAGLTLTFHSPFEVISRSSATFNTLPNQTIVFWLIPNLLTYDESITGFGLDE